VSSTRTPLDLDGPVPCRYCGGAFVWVEQERDPGGPPRWDGRCACGCGHDDAPEVPTWRTWARGDERVRAVVAEVDRLRELLLNAGWPRTAEGIAELATGAERAAVVSALERWAEDAGDPWMSFCSDRIKSGEHRREEE
jgi:hypothetical protein